MKTDNMKRFVYSLRNLPGFGLFCIKIDDLIWLAEVTNGRQIGAQVESDTRLDLSTPAIARHLSACGLTCEIGDRVDSMAKFWQSVAELYPTSTIAEITQMMGQSVPV